ncbi:MAG: cellulase family glycosylhydrolase [Bacteroidales bacterium]|nr:cellulase family glycosylhydrolase [Bacteroidales bacterium]
MPKITQVKWISILILFSILIASCGEKEIPENKFIYAKDGRLFFPDGKELSLWGVNLQPCLSWEYNSLFKLIGVPLRADSLKLATDNALDEIQKMNCDLIRCHLTPSDFTDNEGNLVETVYLDILDYMVAEASNRGIYSYITFLNTNMGFDIDVDEPKDHTPNFVENSFGGKLDRKHLIENEDIVNKSKNYISQLLNRVNPYLKTSYKNTPAIAVWEISNEPTYYSYKQVKETPYYEEFKSWALGQGLEDTEEDYASYRYDLVLNYINDMYDVIRETGAVQPIVWNCNWNKMINGHEEIFDAIGISKVEVVSFCNYPGQSVCKKPYTKNPVDLSGYDFSSFLKNSYTKEDWYGWALRPDFMKKAKVAYEFEIFYNQSAYLYPAQASFFRAMGVQMASMWHYSMPRYAPYRNGSHHLSLTSTPPKAASYAVAGELFRSLPLYHEYDTVSTTEKVTENYMYSYEKNISIYSSDEMYIHSGPVDDNELPEPSGNVKKVIGFGNSPLAKYDGNGIYTINIQDNSIEIEIEPNTEQLKPLWGKDFLVGLVTQLDYLTHHSFELNLKGWDASNSVIYRLENDVKTKIEVLDNSLLSFQAIPGKYLIEK